MRARVPLLWLVVVVVGVVAMASACPPEQPPPAHKGFDFHLPASLPEPPVPSDNPMTAEKVALGRHLFYDKRLSANETRSCGSCHMQADAFTGGAVFRTGDSGEPTTRNEMTLVNAAYAPVYTWADPSPVTLEEQALIPMYGENPVELGLTDHDTEQFEKLRQDPALAALFKSAFPSDADPVTIKNITQALASFERTILSGGSPVDHFLVDGDDGALDADGQHGLSRFFSEDLECYHCHGGFNWTDSAVQAGALADKPPYHNNGLYNLNGTGDYPLIDQGLFSFTQNPADMGKFKAPTLRNLEKTGPYMHDGSVVDFDAILDHYAAGGRTIPGGNDDGSDEDGSKNVHKDPLVKGFVLNDADRAAMKAFFKGLTDPDLLSNVDLSPAFECPTAGVSCPSAPPSFTHDVQPIIENSCLYCHSDGGGAQAEQLGDYASVHALHDKLVTQVTGCLMPADARLPDADREAILQWLACGDPNN
ncbi:MAG TPA: MbnH family di-heme enzyme [Myxococcota bacterium]